MPKEKLIKGRYRIIEALGRGGVATVYTANDEVLDRVVALKVLDERCSRDAAFIERFKREAQAAAGVRHPNVVTIFDSGEYNGSHFIVMEYVEGRTLKDLLAEGALDPDRAVRISIQIARALAHAHRSCIIHRDVKPANIIVAHDGVAKIADFGIARALDRPGITQTGRVLGTAEYLSPEQALGKSADVRSDIYSFGIVLFEMLTGKPPFGGKNPVEVAARHVTEPPPRSCDLNPNVPSGLSSLVDRLLSKDSQVRPAGFDEVVEELLPWVGADRITASLSLKRQVRPAPWLKAGVTVAAFLAVFAVYLTAGRKPVDRLTQNRQAPTTLPSRLKPAVVKDYDPGGNGVERPNEVGLVLDGIPGTAWYAEGYANEDFGNLKEGVGLYVDFGGVRFVKEIRVRSLASGWSAQVKGSNDARNWRVIAEKRDMSTDHTFKTTGGYRYYLLWITKLTRIPGQDGYRVAIDELDFKG
ncbi:MAG: protein kinase [Actinobacteria bacterium]|nr:protein kinase [Actinomycetota bacterium]